MNRKENEHGGPCAIPISALKESEDTDADAAK
jgi:hypothetical protein